MIALFFAFIRSRPAPAAGPKPLAAAFAETGAPAVTTADYEAAAVSALAGLKADDAASALAARDRLLALRVPAADRGAHFTLVSKLTAYAAALNKGKGAEKIWNELKAEAAADQWLKTAAPFQNQ